jgi:hypothetical protein
VGPKPRSKSKKHSKTSNLPNARSPKRGQKWTQKWCSKLVPKSTENIQSKFPQKSTKNHCKRLIYLVFGAVPLNYFLLQFHTRPQISHMRAQRAPRSPITIYSIFQFISISSSSSIFLVFAFYFIRAAGASGIAVDS